jgi:hypothetical protein
LHPVERGVTGARSDGVVRKLNAQVDQGKHRKVECSSEIRRQVGAAVARARAREIIPAQVTDADMREHRGPHDGTERKAAVSAPA